MCVMSKIIPVKEPKYYASRRHEHAEVCPRLEKWMEKNNSGGFAPKRNGKKALQNATKSRKYLGMFTSSKRKRTPGSLRSSPSRRRLSSKRFRDSGKLRGSSPRKSPRKPIRAKTIFNNIRQKSRNFGIRCKTSVSLWKQWIVSGIKWDKHSLSFPRLRSKASVDDIDNLPKSKRNKKELDNYSSNSVISETIEESDEPPEQPAEKPPEVSKVKKFLDMSYIQKATSIFRVGKAKESSKPGSPKSPISPTIKSLKSSVSDKLEDIHEEEDVEDEEDDKTRNDNEDKSEDNNNNELQEYEEVDDISISDRDLGSNTTNNYHPMQTLAKIDTEKIEKIGHEPNGNGNKQSDQVYDEYYEDDIYYDHHLNGYYRTEADPVGDEILRQKAKQAASNKNNAIHRAFNKLKLFF